LRLTDAYTISAPETRENCSKKCGAQSNAKTKVDAARRESAGSHRSRPLNRYATKELDSSGNVYENLAVRNVPKRPDLLPIVKVMPDQSDDAMPGCHDPLGPLYGWRPWTRFSVS
jgi:hypothetical protein